MEDLWKVSDIGYRLGDWADRAEYAKLMRAFRDQERQENYHRLLREGASLEKSDKL